MYDRSRSGAFAPRIGYERYSEVYKLCPYLERHIGAALSGIPNASSC